MSWIGDQFEELIAAMAISIGDAYQALLIELMKILLLWSLPGEDVITSEWYSFGLGGTFGLATKLLSLVTVIVGVWIVLTPTRPAGERVNKVVTSSVMLAIMGYGFYPIYTLATNLSQLLSYAFLQLGTTASQAEAGGLVETIIEIALPTTPYGMIFMSLSGGLFAGLMLIETFALNVWALVLILVYPLSIALRPVHKVFNVLFNVLNAGIVTTLLAPPFMVGCVSFIVLGIEHIPLGETAVGSSMLTLVALLIASAIPAGLAYFTFIGASQVFGRVDADLAGAIDIASMPPMTVDDMSKSVDDAHRAPLGTAPSFDPKSMPDFNADDIGTEIRNWGVKTAASVAVATGHPYIGVGITVADAAIPNNRSRSNSGEESDQP